MLSCLKGRISERKLRLWAVACCWRIGDVFEDVQSRRAVEGARHFADGAVSCEELTKRRMAVSAVIQETRREGVHLDEKPAALVAAVAATRLPFDTDAAAWGVNNAARAAARLPSAYASYNAPHAATIAREAAAQCDLLRDIVGNPFDEKPAIDPLWQRLDHGNIARLVEVIYREERWADLPILADALEEVGCCQEDLLDHLRGPGPRVRGCWVVDRLRGNE
jgi:hypothetical protein